MTIKFCLILKMNQNNSMEAIDKLKLTEQTKFRLSEINGIKNYFQQEINQRNLIVKNSVNMLLHLILLTKF